MWRWTVFAWQGAKETYLEIGSLEGSVPSRQPNTYHDINLGFIFQATKYIPQHSNFGFQSILQRFSLYL